MFNFLTTIFVGVLILFNCFYHNQYNEEKIAFTHILYSYNCKISRKYDSCRNSKCGVVCVFINRLSGQAVCKNHEEVMFQPRKVTATHLGSIAIFNHFIISPPSPPVTTFYGSFYIPYSSYHPPISSRLSS